MPRKGKVQGQVRAPLNVSQVTKYVPKDPTEIKATEWVLPNRVAFSSWMHQVFRYSNKDASSLFPSQRFVKDFIQYDSPYRGVLLYHSLGVGKSCASIVASEGLLTKMKAIVMLPATLRQNFVEEVKHRCGNSFFSVNQKWQYYAIEQLGENAEEIATNAFVSPLWLKKNKGMWLPVSSGMHWDTLNGSQKMEINKQLDHMIDTRYSFIHYNGVKIKDIDEMVASSQTKNPFDNAVVIVDEVHNLISRTVGSGHIGKKLYELLLNAKNAKLILLSGTPIINYPYELSYVVNLLRGPQYEHIFEGKKKGEFDVTKIHDALQNHPYVDTFEVDGTKRTATVRLVPEGFRKSNPTSFKVVRDEENASITKILEDLSRGLLCNLSSSKPVYLLPFDKDTFNELFVDFENLAIKDPRMLSRRMMGCISYFSTFSEDLYPKQLPTQFINVKMSDYQFGVYEKNRYDERKNEEKANKKSRRKRNDKDIFASTGQVYRAFSRANCNFVFPEKIKRPYPSKLSELLKEIDFNEDDQKGLKALVKERETEPNSGAGLQGGARAAAPKDETDKAYAKALNDAMYKLESSGDEYFSKDNLPVYSPKYNALLPLLQTSAGKVLVYSQFRMVEGLGVLSLLLKAYGWCEFKLKKSSNGTWSVDIRDEDKNKPKFFQYRGGEDDTKLLLKIFNNDYGDLPENIREYLTTSNIAGEMLKLIMITQSGAEGISLKHVRDVHILEPYWNEIRINQVIGRAIRAGSHLDLPKKDRTVQVYRYIVSMTASQLKGSNTIRNKDGGITTDEYINKIAENKNKIIGSIQDLMKIASVDCMVHSKHHPSSLKCLQFPINSPESALSYELHLENEERDALREKQINKVNKKLVCKKCKINDKFYALDKESGVLYDYEAYAKQRLVKIGVLESIAGTKQFRLVRE